MIIAPKIKGIPPPALENLMSVSTICRARVTGQHNYARCEVQGECSVNMPYGTAVI